MSDETTTGSGQHVEKIGGFDIRNFIGLLIGIFGLILTVWGIFFFNDYEAAKTGGMNANLWTGLAMIAVGLVFFIWAKLEPIRIVVSDNETGAESPKDIAPLDDDK